MRPETFFFFYIILLFRQPNTTSCLNSFFLSSLPFFTATQSSLEYINKELETQGGKPEKERGKQLKAISIKDPALFRFLSLFFLINQTKKHKLHNVNFSKRKQHNKTKLYIFLFPL